MISKLITIAAGASAAAMMLLVAAPAFANEASDVARSEKTAAITINHKGNVVINRAKVESVGASSFTVNIWGLVWTVQVTDRTKIIRRHNGSSGLSEITKDDSVAVRGDMVPAQLAVNATFVRDDSTRAAAPSGTISGIATPDMFTVTAGKKTWSVKVAPTAEIKVGGVLKTFADLAVGMKVHVKGFVNLLSSQVIAYQVNAK